MLYDAGISISAEVPRKELNPLFRPVTPQHPHRCVVEERFSVSEAMRAHFARRGFTLETLCLALGNNLVTLDPETGTPLPFANPTTDMHGHIPLNIPDCFRNGTPLLDCEMYFHWFWGSANYSERPTRAEFEAEKEHYRGVGRRLDAHMKRLMGARAIAKPLLEYEDYEALVGKEAAEDAFTPGAPGRGVGYIAVSPTLPRGYAYTLTAGTVAGDDHAVDTTNLSAEAKKRIASVRLTLAAPWNKRAPSTK
jgi:hypothetical protein